MLPKEGRFAIILQKKGIATRVQERHVAAALRDKGNIPYCSSRLAEMNSTSTSDGGGLLTAVSSKYAAESASRNSSPVRPQPSFSSYATSRCHRRS